jgi:S-formylglutathione hydrolase
VASAVTLHEILSKHLPAPVPYAVLAPESQGPLPLCILLMGAGGTRESLIDLQPVFDGWWKDGVLPPVTVATPTAGPDYYLEDRAGAIRWESFLTADLIPHIRANFHSTDTTVIAGISGGGYGALKTAFSHPQLFAAVAVMQPMLEPGLRESGVGARNRLHHTAGGPPQLIGPTRDAALWEFNNPANLARDNAAALRDSGMAIYLEAAGRDFLNAHDGAEFLHRTLWDLDLAHEYHLVRDADHGGPTMRPRLRAMFAWLGSLWNAPAADAAIEEAASAWIESGMQGKPPAGSTTTNAFIRSLRARFEPLRAKAAESDPSTARHYGIL